MSYMLVPAAMQFLAHLSLRSRSDLLHRMADCVRCCFHTFRTWIRELERDDEPEELVVELIYELEYASS